MKKFILFTSVLFLAVGSVNAQVVGALQLTTSVTPASACTPPCDGTANVKATGGTAPYTYNWSTTPSQNTATATGLCPGTYSVMVNDAASVPNYAVATVTITCGNISTGTMTVTTSVVHATNCTAPCDGSATANPAGGTPPYTYNWSTNPVQTTQTATGLCPGQYTVMVTDGTPGQPKPVTAVVTVTCTSTSGNTYTVSTSSTAATSCTAPCDGTASASAWGGTPPYTYSWSSAPAQTTQTATGLCPGVYTVTVTDASGNGQSITGTATVTCNAGNPGGTLNVPTTFSPATNCTAPCNGSATASPFGGTPPYTYAWSTTPVQTTQTATGLCPGTYSVNVVDSSSPNPKGGKGVVTIVCSNVSTGINEFVVNDLFGLYPNPAAGELTVSFHHAQQGVVQVQIISAMGNTVVQTSAAMNSGTDLRLDISGLSPGLYSVSVLTDSGRVSHKLIKQ